MPTKVNSLGASRTRKKNTARTGNSRRRAKSSRKHFGRIILLSLVTIFISTLIVGAVYLYKFINAPFSSANAGDAFNDENVWQGDEVNLMIIKVSNLEDESAEVNFMAVANFDLNNYRYRFYDLPLDEEFEYYEGKGTLRNLYKKGSSNDQNAIEFIKKTLRKQFALGFNGYILMDDEGYEKISQTLDGDIPYEDLSSILRVKNTLKIPGLVNEFRNNASTNLTFADTVNFLQFLKSTSETSSYIKSINKYVFLDQGLWDQTWREKLNAEDIKKEYSKVLILNASHDPKIPGLAQWGSRLVENAGGSVLDTQNAYQEFNDNTVISEKESSPIVISLMKTLDVESLTNPQDLKKDNYNPQISRADVTLALTGY